MPYIGGKFLILMTIAMAISIMAAAVLIPQRMITVGGDDVAVDPVSGHCYRLVWVTPDHNRPGGLVTTDGVMCPYGK